MLISIESHHCNHNAIFHSVYVQRSLFTGLPCFEAPYVVFLVIALLLLVILVIPVPILLTVITLKTFSVSFQVTTYKYINLYAGDVYTFYADSLNTILCVIHFRKQSTLVMPCQMV